MPPPSVFLPSQAQAAAEAASSEAASQLKAIKRKKEELEQWQRDLTRQQAEVEQREQELRRREEASHQWEQAAQARETSLEERERAIKLVRPRPSELHCTPSPLISWRHHAVHLTGFHSIWVVRSQWLQVARPLPDASLVDMLKGTPGKLQLCPRHRPVP